MLEWAISSLYWVLCLLLGVFTNLCCETVDVRKRQWIISKNKINQSFSWSISSIKSLINQSSMGIYWWLGVGTGKEKKELGVRFRNVVTWLHWVGRNGSITTVCMWLCAYVCVCVCVSVCVLAFVYMNVRMHARVCVCMCVCMYVCVYETVYVLCVSLTGSRPCAVKMLRRLRSFIFLFWPPSYKNNYRTHQKVIKTLNDVWNVDDICQNIHTTKPSIRS